MNPDEENTVDAAAIQPAQESLDEDPPDDQDSDDDSVTKVTVAENRNAEKLDKSAPDKIEKSREPTEELQRAFPRLTQILKNEKLPTTLVNSLYDNMSTDFNFDWLSVDLSFLDTNRIRISETGQTRRVSALRLRTYSSYCKAAFERWVSERCLNITLGHLTPMASEVLAVIDWMNDTEFVLEITEENCLELFMAADFLGCPAIQDRCLQYIQCTLANSPVEALKLYRLCSKTYVEEIFQACFNQVLRHINMLSCKGYLYQLEFQELIQLLKSDRLNCKLELDVLRIIESWAICKNGRYRLHLQPSQLDELLCEVRFLIMSKQEINYFRKKMRLANQPNLKSRLEGDDFTQTTFYSQYCGQMPRCARRRQSKVVLVISCTTITAEDVHLQRKRKPLAYCMYIDPYTGHLLNKPWDGKRVNHVVDPETVGTEYKEREIGARNYLCCLPVGNYVYVIGGEWEKYIHKKVLRFDRLKPELGWTVCSYLTMHRRHHCCAVAQGFIYAIGGNDVILGDLNKVERLPVDNRSNSLTWTEVAPMLSFRSEATAVEHRGRIFVAGGRDYDAQNTAEIYCPASDSWTRVTGTMFDVQKGISAVTIGDAVYILGSPKRVINRWREESGWSKLDIKTKTKRFKFGCVAINDRILIFGGETSIYPSESTQISSIEFVDIEDETSGSGRLLSVRRKALEEIFSDQPLPMHPGFGSACVLDEL